MIDMGNPQLFVPDDFCIYPMVMARGFIEGFTNPSFYAILSSGNEVLPWETKTACKADDFYGQP